jgi:uncharacterized protein YkwD
MHRLLAVLMLAFGLASCASGGTGSLFQTPLATKPGVVNSAEAATLISQYRRSRGLSAVTVNATLTRIAADHARRMAATNRVDHVLPGEGSFDRRLLSGGYSFSVAAENIGAGQKSLAAALEAWKKSPHHNDNLLNPGVREIGIALVVAPDSKFKTYWSLVLAAPYQASTRAGPNTGPVISAGGVTLGGG